MRHTLFPFRRYFFQVYQHASGNTRKDGAHGKKSRRTDPVGFFQA
ncbi:hypothetical protein BAMY6639_04420 [Bacillus amyloliquefaciens UMAF6639]|nr:hypothetical protein BAMY6639_04420 [Bacillus amyloliquefaciens UMAF6639]